MLKYAEVVEHLVSFEKDADTPPLTQTTGNNIDHTDSEDFIVSTENKITTITLNRPSRKNALTQEVSPLINFNKLGNIKSID